MMARTDEMIQQLTPVLASGRLDLVEAEAAGHMKALPASPFHVLLGLSITNELPEAAQHLDGFFGAQSRNVRIAAAYAEMNAFDINPRRWFFELFAYDRDG